MHGTANLWAPMVRVLAFATGDPEPTDTASKAEGDNRPSPAARAKHVATRGERKTCVRIFRPPGSSASCRVLRPSVHEFAGLGAFGRDDERAELATSLADGESPGLSRSRPRDLSLHAWIATADWSTTRRSRDWRDAGACSQIGRVCFRVRADSRIMPRVGGHTGRTMLYRLGDGVYAPDVLIVRIAQLDLLWFA